MARRAGDAEIVDCTEQKRLNDAREAGVPWKKWGPYLSERQWGTVREDYSQDGNAWDYFTHDQSRSRAYRWGEDGLGGISDDKQRLCFALALWNERDPILKERAVRPHQQRGEPRRGRQGVLLLPRLHADPLVHEVPLQVPAARVPLPRPRRDEPAADAGGARIRAPRHGDLRRRPLLRRLPRVREGGPGRHPDPRHGPQPRPGSGPAAAPADAVVPEHLVVGGRGREAGPARGRAGRSWPPIPSWASTRSPATARRSCSSRRTRATPRGSGASRTRRPTSRTRSTATSSPASVTRSTRRRRGRRPRRATSSRCRRAAARSSSSAWPTARRAGTFGAPSRRRSGSGSPTPTSSTTGSRPARSSEDERRVHRQALAGMLWTKQYYYFDLDRWLKEHQAHPLLGGARGGVRNTEWFHMLNGDVISMPDKWEYPWYAAWDLAFHTHLAVARGLRLRQGAAPPDAPRASTATPTGRSRPTSGTSAT